jgi:CheY-like chemotaxis protein/methyl-accepting chemotaxis protein
MDNLDYNTATTWEKIKHSFKSLRYIGVGKSLLIWFLVISIVPLASISFINFLNAYQGLTIVAEKSLNTTSQLRVEYINTFFRDVVYFLEFNSRQKTDLSLIKDLKNRLAEYNGDFEAFKKSSAYQQLTSEHKDEFKDLMRINGYYDVYFIDTEGNILFSLREESDLGTNLLTGPYRFTRFASASRKVLENKSIQFSDLEFYEPSLNTLSGFFVQPMIDEEGNFIGQIALQVTMDRINQIIQQAAGYGETGQAYLVGKDRMLRSAMRFGREEDILAREIENDKIKDWLFFLQHRSNLQMLKNHELEDEKVSTYDSDQTGKYVLGIYRNLNMLEKMGVNWVLIEEIEHNEAFAYARKLSDIVKLSFIITIILVFFTSILVTRWFVNPIKQLSSWAKQVGIGHLSNKIIKAPHNEIGEMVETFNRLVNSLQAYAGVARSTAKGDYSETVEIRSEEDVLGKSMNQMVESFRQVVSQANRIAQGDYSESVTPRSDKDSLGIALFEMTKTLQKNATEIQNQDWLKSGLNKLDASLSGQRDVKELTTKIIGFLAEYLDAQFGLVYLKGEIDDHLHLTATYAIDIKSLKDIQRIGPGDGLIGQVAIDQKLLIISEKKPNQQKIKLGPVEKDPANFLLYPLRFEDELLGVIQLASLNAFDKLKLAFMKMAGDSISIAISTAKAGEKVRKLLAQTQEQANELAVQQEELRQANEELQEQTSALRTSEENLQAQQEELKVTNEELEERTHALELQRDAIKHKNSELETARREIEQKAKDLEQASRYKSEFLANMSHELRTPLNSILVLSQLLAENRKQHLDSKEMEYSRTINSAGSDLLDLINEILDLSKVESGKIDLHIEKMYFDDLSHYISKTFGPVIDKKGLELFVNISKNMPKHIVTDVQRVYQVLKNLFSNAIKFTHEGSISLSLYRPDITEDLSNSGLDVSKSVAFSVSDTGIGIAPEKLQLIFEAFQQADGTTSRKYGGTGLGLSISKGFAKLLGGEIKVESKEGRGTTFTLYLPVELQINDTNKFNSHPEPRENEMHDDLEDVLKGKETAEVIAKPAELPEINAEAHDDRNAITDGDKVLLVIEDDKTFAGLLYDLAHEHRFKCLVAYDGESGLHYADYYAPSAIILDIGLPGIDGYEVMNRLKRNKRTRHIPVHFISAVDKSLDTLKLGAIGFLSKPVSRESLEEAFTRIEEIVSNPIKHLLIVEDDESMRKSISNLMSDEHILVTAVDSGEDAIEKLKAEKYDCLILDLGLKNMSGFELLEMIKKDESMSYLPVVVYTARELTKEEDLKLQLYADSIILKGARSFERLLSETTLFLHQIESQLPEKKQEMLKKIHGREDVLSNKTILVVDDDMRNVFALTSVLENYNISVIIGKNGREGLKKLEENSKEIDLIMMDIMMPEMDGYEAMKEIRKQNKYKKLPIIALTAKAMKDDREKCLAAGANEYLSKPVDTEKLISLLRVWLYK